MTDSSKNGHDSGSAKNPRKIQSLVLDAAPLLVQARIAGLADKYYIPPSVVAELRDARARDYLHTLHTVSYTHLTLPTICSV